jgi:hypothetical protein
MRNRTPRRSVALDLRQPSYARVRPAAISAAHTPLGRCCCAGDCRMTSVTSMYPLAALRKGKRRRPGYVHMIQVMDHDDAPKLVALASTRGIDRHFLRTPSAPRMGGTMSMQSACAHLGAIQSVKQPQNLVCNESIKTGDSRMHLRTCQTCGATLCCDSSPNRHATRHARVSGHSVAASAEPGARSLYCYPEDAVAEYETPCAR